MGSFPETYNDPRRFWKTAHLPLPILDKRRLGRHLVSVLKECRLAAKRITETVFTSLRGQTVGSKKSIQFSNYILQSADKQIAP